MKRFLVPFLMLTLHSAGPFVAACQDTETTGTMELMDEEIGSLAPTPARIQLWTNKLGYNTGEQMQVRLSLDPMGDTAEYTMFLYRENTESSERQHIDGLANSYTLSDVVTDSKGMSGDLIAPAALRAASGTLIWRGGVPVPGLWQFVAELRSADTTQVVKKAYAKFVVTRNAPWIYGEDGTDTEISTDTTWTNDTIYKVKHQVFVESGATLTIEPGTLILASGRNAVIVVEKGGKIIAEATREAPIVMTCDADVGQRESGCWGGLIVLGNAPVTRTDGRAEGVIPATRAAYGGDDPMDSSGVLRYTRVEFAGVDFNSETQHNAFGFHGVGAGTVIDHIQSHEGGDDGIEFFGGTANCTYCVSSGSKDGSLNWAFGWQGTAQFVFVLQDSRSDNGIEGDNDSAGFDRTPRSHPKLYNVTMVGALASYLRPTSNDGMRIRVGSQLTARNVLITGFGGNAVNVLDNSPSFFADGTSSIKNSIIYRNGGMAGDAQIAGGVEATVEYMEVDPMLVNVRWEANPDPRPTAGSYALKLGAAATPPSDGTLDTRAQCIGAFCKGENWLEEWTFFGPESDYDVE